MLRFGIACICALIFSFLPARAAGTPPLRPDGRFTPGVIDPAITQANIHTTICVHGYTARVRKPSAGAERRTIFAEYGLSPKGQGSPFEDDHLISLELGGSNAVRNRWPESYVTKPWNAHLKDRLENRLHALICNGTIPLAEAQHAIATDWIAAYGKYVGKSPP